MTRNHVRHTAAMTGFALSEGTLPPEAEGVVNDCKGEFPAVTNAFLPRSEFTRGKLGLRRSPMEDMDRFNALARQVTGGDRDPLRKAYALMLATGLTPKQLVDRGKPGIEALLRCTVVTRRAELVKNPAGLASRILLTVKRLSEQFPDCGLPIVPDPTMQPKIPLISLIREPRQFTTDRRNWVKIFDEEREADRNTGEADECTTPKTYVRSARMCLAVADVLGLVTDDTVGILALSTNDIFQMVFDRMDKLLTSANVASVAAGLSRIANDLYGEDPEHADHLEALRGEVGRRFPDLTLNDNSIAKIVHFRNCPGSPA